MNLVMATSIVEFFKEFMGIGEVKGLIPIIIVLVLMFVVIMFLLGGAIKKIASQLKLGNVIVGVVIIVIIPIIMIYITKAFASVGSW